jgi:hypothetical protein
MEPCSATIKMGDDAVEKDLTGTYYNMCVERVAYIRVVGKIIAMWRCFLGLWLMLL